MKVTEKDVRYIAELSRLEISEEEMPISNPPSVSFRFTM